jgi:hypothetical protein
MRPAPTFRRTLGFAETAILGLVIILLILPL